MNFIFAIVCFFLHDLQTLSGSKASTCKAEISRACAGCTDGTQVIQCVSGGVFSFCGASQQVSCNGSGHTCSQASGSGDCKKQQEEMSAQHQQLNALTAPVIAVGAEELSLP